MTTTKTTTTKTMTASTHAPRLGRRALVSGAACLSVLGLPRVASAGRTRRVTEDAVGTTLELELAHAPFPALASPWTDSTVHVFVPSYLARAGKEVSLVVHFHGHSTTAERAMAHHRLREQLAESRQDAILVVPQGPVMAPDSSCGKLETPGGLRRMLEELLVVLAAPETTRAVGRRVVAKGAAPSRVVLSAHSGGYHAAAACLRNGGLDVNEVFLFDALYAEAATFRDWVLASRTRSQRLRHKLVSYYTGGTTEQQTRWLFDELARGGVDVARETHEGELSRAEITLAQAVSVRTANAHGGVTFEWNALRDCLHASALTRHLRSSWFDRKHGARPIERRR